MGKNYQDRQDEPEKAEGVIPGIKRLLECPPWVSGRKVRETHQLLRAGTMLPLPEAPLFAEKKWVVAQGDPVAQF